MLNIYDNDFCVDYAFHGLNKLIDLTFKCPLTTIGYGAFYKCLVLKAVFFDEGVQTIGPYMFKNCADLLNVTISSTVSTISTAPFIGCYYLIFFNVSNENPNYFEHDGILFE